MAIIKADQGSVWLQRRPGATLTYGGDCLGVNDISQDLGDVTTYTCRDRTRNGRRKVVGSEQGAAGEVTTSIEVPVASSRNAIMSALMECPQTLFVNKWTGNGPIDDFSNRSMTIALLNARPTSRGVSNPLSRDESDDRTLLTMDLSAEDFIEFYNLEVSRLTTAETADLHVVLANLDLQCETEDDVYQAVGEVAFIGGEAVVGSPSDTAALLFSADSGGTWAAAATDPFAGGENAEAATRFSYGGGTRYMVARTETDAGNPAEIAYTDDSGATWTAVDVGSANGQFVTSLWANDSASIWAGTDDGYIYRSTDAGATWSAIESGVIATTDYLAIHGISRDVVWFVGEGDVLAYTINGSNTTPTISAASADTGSGDDITAVDVHSRYRVWVATDGGDAYLTTDGGATWSAKFTSSGAASDIEFSDDGLSGFLLINSGGVGTVYHSRNGGANWEALTTPTNTGLNDVFVLDTLDAYVVGNAQGGTGFVAVIQPAEDVI